MNDLMKVQSGGPVPDAGDTVGSAMQHLSRVLDNLIATTREFIQHVDEGGAMRLDSVPSTGPVAVPTACATPLVAKLDALSTAAAALEREVSKASELLAL